MARKAKNKEAVADTGGAPAEKKTGGRGVVAEKAEGSTSTFISSEKRKQYEKAPADKAKGLKAYTSNGDAVAVAVRAFGREEMLQLARDNGIPDEKLAKYENLNNGQVKMGVANMLRAMVKREEKVKINGKIIYAL